MKGNNQFIFYGLLSNQQHIIEALTLII